MENEEHYPESRINEQSIPTAEELIPDTIEKRKNSIKNLLTEWMKINSINPENSESLIFNKY